MSLSDRSHETRRAALAAHERATRADAETKVQALRADIGRVAQAADVAVAKARAEVDATMREHSRDIARRFLEAATPLAVELASAPRAAAVKLAEVIRAHDAEAREATGVPLDSRLVAFALATPLGLADKLGAPDYFAHNGAGKTPAAAEHLFALALRRAPDAAIQGACTDLEVAVAVEADRAAYAYPDRAKAMQTYSAANLNAEAAEQLASAKRASAPRDVTIAPRPKKVEEASTPANVLDRARSFYSGIRP